VWVGLVRNWGGFEELGRKLLWTEAVLCWDVGKAERNKSDEN